MNNQSSHENNQGITIRLAGVSDALSLAMNRYIFRASLNTVNENEEEFVRRCSIWMQERLREDSRWRCWVAEQNRQLVGNLWMQRIEKIPNPIDELEYHAYITNFYVKEEARNKGIGSKLLSAALEWAKEEDVEAVILWPTAQSRALYVRHGFAVREDLLEQLLDRTEDRS